MSTPKVTAQDRIQCSASRKCWTVCSLNLVLSDVIHHEANNNYCRASIRALRRNRVTNERWICVRLPQMLFGFSFISFERFIHGAAILNILLLYRQHLPPRTRQISFKRWNDVCNASTSVRGKRNVCECMCHGGVLYSKTESFVVAVSRMK